MAGRFTNDDVRKELRLTIVQINELISNVYIQAGTCQDADPYQLRTPDGNFVLAPLLTAKANALAALVALAGFSPVTPKD